MNKSIEVIRELLEHQNIVYMSGELFVKDKILSIEYFCGIMIDNKIILKEDGIKILETNDVTVCDEIWSMLNGDNNKTHNRHRKDRIYLEK